MNTGDENDLHNDPVLKQLYLVYSKNKEETDSKLRQQGATDICPPKLTIVVSELHQGTKDPFSFENSFVNMSLLPYICILEIDTSSFRTVTVREHKDSLIYDEVKQQKPGKMQGSKSHSFIKTGSKGESKIKISASNPSLNEPRSGMLYDFPIVLLAKDDLAITDSPKSKAPPSKSPSILVNDVVSISFHNTFLNVNTKVNDTL